MTLFRNTIKYCDNFRYKIRIFFSIFDQLTRNNGLKQWAEEGLSFIDQEYADAKAC